MPDQNPFDLLVSPAKTSEPATQNQTPANPFDSLMSSGSGGSSVPTAGSSVASVASSPAPNFSSNPFDSLTTNSPDNGQPPASVQHLYQDSSQPWYKRAWDWANTPLTESLFGLPEERQGAGGFERAVEHIASGLTSPLSLALTAATFGTGGIIESAGTTALKEAGLSAEEIANAVKGSEVALKAANDLKPVEPVIQSALEAGGHDLKLLQRAKDVIGPVDKSAELADPAVQKTLLDSGKFTPEELQDLTKTSETIAQAKAGFKPVEDALREAGVDVDKWKQAQATLYDHGLTEHDLLGGNAMERGTFQLLRHVVPDLPIATTVRAAKTANTIMNAGFTYQQLESAAAMSPRFLDALKEGDTDKAWEYGTEAVAGGALGIAGASHALHSAGELFKPLIETDKFRPNDEWLAVDRANKEREAQHAVAEQEALQVSRKAKQLLGHEDARAILGDTPEVKAKKAQELATTELGVHTGMDAGKAALWHDALAEADGQDTRLSPFNRPENGQSYGSPNEADEWDRLENTVYGLTGKDPSDVSLSDLEAAKVPQSVIDGWDDYLKRNPAKAETPELAKYARTQTLPAVGPHLPVVLLNDFAHEILTRMAMDTRDWAGAEFTNEDIGKIVSGLREEAQKGDRNNLLTLANELEKASQGGKSVIVTKKVGGSALTIPHEQVHAWQTHHPLPEEATAPLLQDKNYIKATYSLYKKGYTPQMDLPSEILSHLSTDDLLGLTKPEAVDLTKRFLSLYPKDAVSEFPNRNDVTLNALKELGYNENINQAANRGILYQTSRVFGDAKGTTHPDLPENIRDLIANNKFSALPDSYKKTVLTALKQIATDRVPDHVKSAVQYLREQQDKNFEIGSAHDLLHNYLEDYMTRVYKDQNPEGKVILSNAKSGKFATRVTMARNRVYDSTLTALLKSPKEMVLDPVDSTATGRAQLIKAAANKQLIDSLRDKFTRASDGRPAVVLSGRGNVVSGPNGEDPKTFIDPDRVRKINIAPEVIQHMEKTGDLQRYLDEGTIRDITPYVRPDNIGAAIDRLEEQAQRKEAVYDEVGNNKLRTDIMYLKSMMNNRDFSGLKAFNEEQPKVYAWDPQDYINLDHSAMKGWNFVTNSSDGSPIFVRSNILVHPEFADYLKNRLGLEQGALSKHPIGKALLSTGTKAKEVLLSLSPFHLVQIGLRGLMTGVNPFTLHGPDILDGAKIDPSDPNSPTKMYKMVEQGMTTGTDYKGQQEYSEGVSAGNPSLLRKIPVVGNVVANSQQWWTDFLFKRYLPAIKATAAEKMFDDYRAKYPEWSVDKVAKAAGQHANDSFGGINWRALGRSATTQEFARALLLAPDWFESELRSGARLFNKDEGGVGRSQVLKMAGAMWLLARVLNKVTTGNYHFEAPFGLAVKNKEGKETIFGMRTLPTDLLHAASDPVGFVKGRLSPVIRTGQELLTQRDQFGRKLGPEDLWADVFHQAAPIPLQSLGQAISGSGPEIGNTGQGWKAVGGTAQTYTTPAQKMAADLASNHSEDGPVDPAQMARHRRVMQFEDAVRSGQMPWSDLMRMTYETDALKESELKKIQNNLKKTHGMPPDMASLYTRASRLPAKEYLDLLDVANPSEKAALIPLTIQVQRKYLTKAKKDETPEERAKDPIFQRLLNLNPRMQNSQ